MSNRRQKQKQTQAKKQSSIAYHSYKWMPIIHQENVAKIITEMREKS